MQSEPGIREVCRAATLEVCGSTYGAIDGTDARLSGALETPSLRAVEGLCLKYLETGRWRRDFLDAWTTGDPKGISSADSRLARIVSLYA